MTSTTKPDYWSILGLVPGSNIDQIKSAFRSEARRWHPDLNVNDINAEERFKLINEAYAVLSDSKKRASWEALNTPITNELFANGFPSYNEYIDVVLGINNYENVDQDNTQRIEKEFIQQNHQYDYDYQDYEKPTQSPNQPPPIKQVEDIETVIDLTPEQALNGTTIEIELANGTIVEVLTPPFTGDGWRLRLSGVVVGGRDHFLHLKVQTEDGLRIDGLRVLYRLELFPQDALFGCGVEIPTLDGPVILQVPPKSSSGRLLRLRGRGLQFEDLTGDQIVEIVVVLPADLTDSELALYKRLQELSFDEE
ncbi:MULTISPECIES: DnaJ domain-containing protein [Prochlorococcus]|uniref:DnaJ-class molecular chaperone n=1 Tax=Prochlorococcus marinus (strain SARG / CCMP1375 / SS120) TaxID=167539 RepID=Q7VC03_PROMA|nr:MULTISPECIES: DnaJ domain-containing protein [Prochlorococcus]AAP99983.1 DnaJ-class molecular chaperone [Prochlorococcus marinus subsp. marinus str. CCMP1375]KGG13781.1 DnaJ-class molecular chaperone CbpA [Prochlorococcus marinus str. LG]KGG18916.1 DnaJ-class molecular chaperone CbpA [Prochlorococcus marinus str. SS2]KGG23546.1 DnaJ-class molecular chaperone CbpA [Prochlorococcus marinus str. SS35]KGG32218.1 DnaJ-class molecular chaperone CbpA [Prochlorococcus marinus str. SS51]